MALTERIRRDLEAAMRAGETLRRDTLRMVIAALKNRRIELGAELTEEQELAVLQGAVKSRAESAVQYEAAGRGELAEKERAEIAVIQGYLPELFSEDETRELVRAKLDELEVRSPKDIGKLMKAVMAEHRGRVDGKTVQRIAAELLAK